MSSNRLSLNPNKTQFIWFGTPQQLSKLDLPMLTERFPSFAFYSSVRNLGVVLDSTLTFSEHVANLIRSSYISTSAAFNQTLRLLSCLYLNCPCLRLLSHRLLQFSSGWSSKGSSFSYSVCSKRCC